MRPKNIIWPQGRRDAVNAYLRFAVRTVEAYEIVFSEEAPNPVNAAQAYISGEIDDEQRIAIARVWLSILDVRGGGQESKTKEAVNARIALCLLVINIKKNNDLWRYVDWFLEVLGIYSLDLSAAKEIMWDSFGFES